MGSLVLDLQADALDPKTDTSDLLRKAKVIATKLDIPDLGKWTDLELNGYPDANNVPEYRMIRGELRAFNPYNRIWCEFVWGPKGIPHALLRRPVTQSVSSLGQVLNDKSDALTFSLPSQLRQWVMDNSDSPLPPTFFISAAAVKGIVDVVRNSVLEWALRLEKEGILGEGMTFSRDEKGKARATVVVQHIQNFQGIIGDVDRSSVALTLTQIVKNDIESLKAHLKAQGLSQPDLNELEEAIANDPKPKDANFGPRVSGWMGKMVAKAAAGTWQIAIGAAGKVLADAIIKYYGL